MQPHGFTLIELVIALAIAGVLTSFAVFWSQGFAHNKRADATVNAFAAAVHLARHAAIAANAPVVFCPRQTDACGPRNSWHRGALAFVDFNRNQKVDGSDYVIKSLPPLEKPMRVYWRSFRNRSYLRFTPTGLTDWQNGHFLFCINRADMKTARQLVLNVAGRMYFSNDQDGDDVHEDAHGRPLECP